MPKEKKTKDVLAPRASKVTKPKDKEKKRASKASGTTFKSAERIVDSDDEDVHDQPLPPVTNGGTAVGITGHDGHVNGSKSKPSKQSSKKDSQVLDALTLESKKRIEQLAKNDDSDSSEEESDDDESVAEMPSKTGQIVADVDDSSSGEDDNDDGDESRDEEQTVQDSTHEQQGARKPNTSIKHVSSANGRIDNEIEDSNLRPTTQYIPPTGFRVIKDESISADTVDLLSPQSTRDKEIWYISAPASLPITALQEVALEKFAKQQPIMVHDGAQYALVSDPAAREATRLLLPSKRKNGYQVVSSPVDHVLQFQQIPDVQATAIKGRPKTTAQVLLDTHLPTKPAKKSQPKGMKARFRPIGFGVGDLGDIGSSEDDEVQTPVTFRQPPTLTNGDSLSTKRKEPTNLPANDKSEKKKSKRDQHQQVLVEMSEDIARKNESYVVEATTSISADQETAPPESQMPEGRKKKKKEKKVKSADPSLEDVPMQDATLPAFEDGAMQVEGDKEKTKKKKKDKTGAVDITASDPIDELSEKKKRKKEKKEKRKSGVKEE